MKEGVPLEFRKRTSDSWGWKSSTFQGEAKEKEGGGEREDPRVAKGVVLRKCLKIQRTWLLYIYVWKTDCKCRVTIEKRDCWWKEVLEEEGGDEIDSLAEGLLPLWDRQERREAGGRSWAVKKLSPKDVGLRKLLDKDVCQERGGSDRVADVWNHHDQVFQGGRSCLSQSYRWDLTYLVAGLGERWEGTEEIQRLYT